jgi:succinate dehydrogenase / fumarate reductase cytochrome b subunit
MTTLVTTVTETLRYRGRIGQWSWVLHRIAGLGTVLFLVLHVIDTSWSAFFPKEYNTVIHEYQSPLFVIGEFVLIACVVYHAFNGLRIILLDYKPEWWAYQQRAATLALAAAVLVLIPTFAVMVNHAVNFYNGNPNVTGLDQIIDTQSQFVLGFVVIIVVAIALSAVYGLIVRSGGGFRLSGRLDLHACVRRAHSAPGVWASRHDARYSGRVRYHRQRNPRGGDRGCESERPGGRVCGRPVEYAAGWRRDLAYLRRPAAGAGRGSRLQRAATCGQ